MDGLNEGKEIRGLVGKVTNFSVRVKTEHLRNFRGKRLLNVFFIALPVKFLGDGTLETGGHGELHLLQDLGLNELDEISRVATSVHIISDMSSVHDISENVSQIGIRYLLITGKIIVDNLTTDSEITIVETIVS